MNAINDVITFESGKFPIVVKNSEGNDFLSKACFDLFKKVGDDIFQIIQGCDIDKKVFERLPFADSIHDPKNNPAKTADEAFIVNKVGFILDTKLSRIKLLDDNDNSLEKVA